MSCLRYYSDCLLCWHYLRPFRCQYVRCKHIAVLGITQHPLYEVHEMFEEQIDPEFPNIDMDSSIVSALSENAPFIPIESSLVLSESDPINPIESIEPIEPNLVLSQSASIKPAIDDEKRTPSREIISIKVIGREKKIFVRDNATGIISVIRKLI